MTFTWNSEGRLTVVKEEEIETKQKDGSSYLEKESCEEHYFYNADNHVDYLIGLELKSEDGIETVRKYYKEVFKYNKLGMWVGKEKDTDDSLKEEFNKSLTATAASLQAAPNTDDMTDGYHDINTNDGVFVTYGSYMVSNGQIIGGHYQQFIQSTASVPSNPEYNYTEPQIPLDSNDEVGYGQNSYYWHYQWDTSSQSWECMSAPSVAEHVYKNGSDIVCDIYDKDQQKVSTTTYSFDDKERLVKQTGADKEITYTYLEDDSNYLLESTTMEGGVSNVKHFYYSIHNYVQPTGIEDVKATAGEDDMYYDLQGRRIKEPSAHGIYIVNGKKVMK